MARQLLLPLLLLIAIAAADGVVAAASLSPGDRTRKVGRAQSVFSLFNLNSRSKFWSESVIRGGGYDDLSHSVSPESWKMAISNFTNSGNIANYMQLSEVESIYIQVPVNFIFIGFEGYGNFEFKLGPEELERWFTKIDHIFEHTRIPPIGEILTPFYKTSIQKAHHHHLPLVSHINYNFSVHAIQMGEKVASIFEHALKTLSRKDDVFDSRENGDVLWQVDMDRMEHIFSTLVHYLQLEEAYNIFILNPKKNNTRLRYGYRKGISESEINLLKEDKNLQSRILQSANGKRIFLDIDRDEIRPLYRSHPLTNFAWTTTQDADMEEWSKKCSEALRSVEKQNEGKKDVDVFVDKVAQILHNHGDSINHLYATELKSGDLKALHAECLTDTWIGKDRWAFIDLSAGPFSWGPTVGGEGVRTEFSLPNVTRTVGATAEISEEEADKMLQDAVMERFSTFAEDHRAIDILLAEMDIYELFSFKHCKGRRVKLSLCEELDERMRELKGELEGYSGDRFDEHEKGKALDALSRMESWNLFSDVPEDHHSYTVARDSFLADLGSTLWGSMRHVIAPSVSHRAYHYYEKISFQLYFVTQEKLRTINQLPLDTKSIIDGLTSLVLPSQKAMFNPHMMSLSEEPALAMAFSVSRRAAAVPFLLVNGTYRSAVRSYLDSAILEQQLQRLNDDGSLKGAHSNVRSTLEVPIFWFIHNDPLLLDKHYQAKALSNIVVVIQSEAASWESHLQCNGKPLLWDLRKPFKAAIAAAAEYIAGVLPSHLIYSHAHETAIEDWTWSVGCNILSVTSQGWQVSQFQSDVIARSYILTALEESVLSVNTAIQLLMAERASAQGFKLFKSQERTMIDKYNSVISLWRRISTISSGLRYSDAAKLLSSLEDASRGFSDAVNSTISLLHPIHCTRERKFDVSWDWTTVPAFAVVFALLWFVLRPRRRKPKIN